MDRLTRFSFNLFKISSLGLVLCYLIAVVMVGAAGHSSGDSVSFTIIALYSITLYFSINRYKRLSVLKKSISGFSKVFLVILIFPILILATIFLIGLLIDPMRSHGEVLLMILILLTFIISALIVMKYILFNKKDKKVEPDDTDFN